MSTITKRFLAAQEARAEKARADAARVEAEVAAARQQAAVQAQAKLDAYDRDLVRNYDASDAQAELDAAQAALLGALKETPAFAALIEFERLSWSKRNEAEQVTHAAERIGATVDTGGLAAGVGLGGVDLSRFLAQLVQTEGRRLAAVDAEARNARRDIAGELAD